MRNRIPTEVLENGAVRYAFYDSNGNFLRYEYILPADEPAEPGTPLNKATLLTDATEKAIFGNIANRTVNDALQFGAGVIRYTLNARTEIMTLEDQKSTHLIEYAAATDGNGNVLFAGGNYSAAVDIYDTDGVRHDGVSLSVGVSELAAATDGAGCVLFGGGAKSSSGSARYISTVNKYALDGTRTSLTALSLARYGLAAATDGNGRVLFGGGFSSSYKNNGVVDRYDTSGSRTTLQPLEKQAFDLAAATDGNGCVLFGGGVYIDGNSNNFYLAVVNKYDVSGTRSTLTPLSLARRNLVAATDGNGNVLFAGGYKDFAYYAEVDKYDTSGTRTSLTSLSLARYSLAAATDGNGNVLFGGGVDDSSSSSIHTDIVEQYDVSGNKTLLEPLSVGRSKLAAATDGNGNVIFGGGAKSNGSTAAVDKYDINGRPVEITVVPGSSYKFQEHTKEQQTGLTETTITVKRPNKGYVRLNGHVID